MLLDRQPGSLRLDEVADPRPAPGQALLRVAACGVCRTDLHVADGEVAAGHLPLVPGHQIVATVLDAASDTDIAVGARVGVPWLAWTCGECRFCRSGRENLCDRALFTGRDVDGGFADLAVADARYCLPLPDGFGDTEAAPLLCAGLIGYRALRAAGEAARLGLYGFGAAAHVVCQVAVHEGREVFAFTRGDDERSQAFARELGAQWAGDSLAAPAEELDAAIIFAPVGALVPAALRVVAKGGTVVCAGIHMSDIPSLPYEFLWGERVIRSVANLTRDDGREFLALAPQVPVRTHVTQYALEDAQRALDDLRAGALDGAAVVVPGAR
jgi:alcohol dehydrogenase, propanol-preferring